MNYLYTFIALMIIWLLYMRFEATFLKVKRVRFTKDRKHLKVLQLSDIHIHRLKVSYSRIKQVIDNEKPDLIILTGDYIEHRKHMEEFFSFIQLVLNGRDNMYACLGNHDFEALDGDDEAVENYIRKIENFGITFLQNASVCFEKNSKIYNIIGITDMRYGKNDVGKALKSCSPNAFANIAFSHNPDIIFEIPKNKVDYLFCGHFHGGQIWAPFDFEFKLLRHEKLCKMGVRKGLHKINGILLYINSGLGNVVVPLRFLSRPEITIYYLP